MLHSGIDRRRDQGVARNGVVAIIFERLLDALRNHDRSREVQDRADVPLGEDAVDQLAVGDIALVEGHLVGNEVARSGREIVDDGDVPARIAQGKDRVAADIAGPTGYEHRNFGHAARSLADGRSRGKPQNSERNQKDRYRSNTASRNWLIVSLNACASDLWPLRLNSHRGRCLDGIVHRLDDGFPMQLAHMGKPHAQTVDDRLQRKILPAKAKQHVMIALALIRLEIGSVNSHPMSLTVRPLTVVFAVQPVVLFWMSELPLKSTR